MRSNEINLGIFAKPNFADHVIRRTNLDSLGFFTSVTDEVNLWFRRDTHAYPDELFCLKVFGPRKRSKGTDFSDETPPLSYQQLRTHYPDRWQVETKDPDDHLVRSQLLFGVELQQELTEIGMLLR